MSPQTINISWWNLGGAIRRRVRTNFSLRKYLKSNCDIFAYGEALAKNQRGLSLPGYFTIMHSSKPLSTNACRRGIVIFCLEKYRQKNSKVYATNKFDIIWLCFPTDEGNVYFCFFYAPGDHHNQSLRIDFYSVLQKSFDKFSKVGKIYMLGDSNARLGSILDDRDINGVFLFQIKTNLFY